MAANIEEEDKRGRINEQNRTSITRGCVPIVYYLVNFLTSYYLLGTSIKRIHIILWREMYFESKEGCLYSSLHVQN